MTFEGLASEVGEVLKAGVGAPLADASFNELALRVFRFQCAENRAYGAFVARRGFEAGRVDRWESVPFLPTRAFKAARLVAGDPEKAATVFRTSGTTEGAEERGEHWVRDLSLYRASLLPNFRAHLIPESGGRFRVFSLLPSPSDAPDSSLSFMMGEVTREFGLDGSGFFVSAEGRIDSEVFRLALENAQDSEKPILLAGTAFSFVRWIEETMDRGWDVSLPPGSRIMETGGYKGRSRELARADLYAGLQRAFGVGESRIVNEYGMTELLSQFYEPIQANVRDLEEDAIGVGEGALEARYHRGPPWVRTLVLDPMTLSPVPDGEVGVLAHLDLANLGSVSAVLTEDLGRKAGDGFRLLGRAAGSEPRGCSLAMEDFLSSRRDGP